MEFPQGKGEQGQGVVGAGVLDGRLHEGLLQLDSRHLGRPLDDLGDAHAGQRRQRQLLQGHREPFRGLQVAEKIRSQRHHHLEAGAFPQGGTKDGEKAPQLLWIRLCEQLLRLVHRNQHLGPLGLVRQP